jgi:hypothetical protein
MMREVGTANILKSMPTTDGFRICKMRADNR